jgi:two-component system chemotaxis sensor kinase CheA
MENFRDKFQEEALDLVIELEAVLLRMENGNEDKTHVEHIFRIMHTLKGNSAMFGFSLIDQYTHQLETVYDLIRNGKMDLSPDLMDLTLASVDHIRNLLNEDKNLSPETQAVHTRLLSRINMISGNDNRKTDSPMPASMVKEEIRTYYISFIPAEDILSNGTNPLFLVEDFGTIGEFISIPNMDALPSFDVYDPEKCYTGWEIILSTKEDPEKIREIFIFAEDKCTIEIHRISDTNLLNEKSFVERINVMRKEGKKAGIQKVRELISTAGKESKNDESIKPSDINEVAGKLKNISSIRVSSEKLDELINLVSELVTTQAGLSLLAEKINNKELLAVAEDVEKLSRRLRDNTFGIRLIPIENMITRFQRLVRELSHELNKNIAFVIEGSEIELDKTIIEGLIDPIMHIIRNSADHGIESEEERKKAGKPEQGKIILRAYHSGTNVFIKISDDGKGIDPDNIRKHAIQKSLIKTESILSRKEILDLIFLPGFTTSDKITKISGRGVGMDVVRKKISELRGEVTLESKPGLGTDITIKLPITLSIIDGLLVEINKSYFVIPLHSVNKCFEFRHDSLANAINNLIFINDRHIPFAYLRKEFGITTAPPAIEQVVVIEYSGILFGLAVDHVIGEYQAVLKSLGIMYLKQDFVSGATILGDGTVALILDPNKIISSFTYADSEVKLSVN